MHKSFTRARPFLVIPMALLCAGSMSAPRPSNQTPEPRVIEVIARRFAFEPAAIEATVGERLRLVIRSGDGVHGIEIKKFRVNREIPRGGAAVAIDFTATEAGRFPILCSEFCGDGHEDMQGTLVVQTAEGQPRP